MSVDKVSETEELTFEEQVWDYLVNQYENEFAAAALMGNADYEMALCPYRTEGDKEINNAGIYEFSKEYTEKVDNGEISRDDFVYSGPYGGGYGLFSWTGVGRKANLYDYAKARGTSISDWKMQLDFAYEEIVDRYHELYCTLLTAESVEEATESFGIIFEQAVNIGYTLIRRSEIANDYYNKFGSGNFTPLYEKGELLPINHSYDYMNKEIEENTTDTSIYPYIAEVVLFKNGYMDKAPEGYYGVELTNAIERLQIDRGITPDGVLGPRIWSILDKM